MNQSIKINKWTVKGKTPDVAAELVPTAIKRKLCTKCPGGTDILLEKRFSFHTAALVSLSPSMDRLFGLDQNKSVQGFRSNFTDFRGISQSYQIILDLCIIYLLIFLVVLLLSFCAQKDTGVAQGGRCASAWGCTELWEAFAGSSSIVDSSVSATKSSQRTRKSSPSTFKLE